jgi:hypothetical protein
MSSSTTTRVRETGCLPGGAMHACTFTPSFIPYLGEQAACSSIHACPLLGAISDLMLSRSRFDSVCMNMLRLLSLKMAAAIPGSHSQ